MLPFFVSDAALLLLHPLRPPLDFPDRMLENHERGVRESLCTVLKMIGTLTMTTAVNCYQRLVLPIHL